MSSTQNKIADMSCDETRHPPPPLLIETKLYKRERYQIKEYVAICCFSFPSSPTKTWNEKVNKIVNQDKYNDNLAILSSLNISLLPVLFFFNFLYYTDTVSTTMVLLMYSMYISGKLYLKFIFS